VIRAPRRHIAVAAAAALLALAGCGDDGGSSPQPPAAAPLPAFAPAGKAACSEEAYTASAADGGWTHPSQNFYAPGDDPMPSENDLQHLLVADAAVIVRYRPDAPAEAREALRGWAGTKAAIVTLPGKTAGDVAVEAFTSNRRLVCDGVDAAQLTTFADRRGAVQSVPHDEEG
jgi:hypothetical protein